MLSSNQPGEIVGTVEALKRTLQSADADFHVLADQLVNGHDRKFSETDAQVIYNEAYQAGFDAGRITERKEHQSFRSVNINSPDWHMMVEDCLNHRRLRGSREQEFLEGLLRWIERGGEPSEKQRVWLEDIHARPPI